MSTSDEHRLDLAPLMPATMKKQALRCLSLCGMGRGNGGQGCLLLPLHRSSIVTPLMAAVEPLRR